MSVDRGLGRWYRPAALFLRGNWPETSGVLVALAEGNYAEMSLMDPSLFVGGWTAVARPSLSPILASVTVDLDKSVFIQMAVFAVLIVVLKPLLFDPLLAVFALREERTDGAKAEARTMQERAAEILSGYESKLNHVRLEASHERETLRRETAQLESKIIDEARASTEGIVNEGRRRIAAEMATFEEDLKAREVTVTQDITSRVLGREMSA